MTDQKISRAAQKPPLWLIAWQCLVGVARVFQYGAKKYAPGNWHQATLDDGAAERYLSAASRHAMMMQEPNGLFSRESLAARDDESGGYHLDHAICSLIMLRGILIKEGVLDVDPGELKAPPTAKDILDRTKIRADILRQVGQHDACGTVGVILSGQTMAFRVEVDALLREGVLRRLGDGVARTYGPEPLPKGPQTHDTISEHYARRERCCADPSTCSPEGCR